MTALSLHDWLQTPLGRYVLEREQTILDEAVADVFGFNALQASLTEIQALRANRIPNQVTLSPEGPCTLRGRPEALPVATASIDLAVLPHGLEFSPDPYAILRELDRVMMPEGRLIITGFNPHSLWGLRQSFSGKDAGYPWCGHFISLSRLKDWLGLLGFEVSGGRLWAYAPPFTSERWLRRFGFLEKAGDRWWGVGGGVYMLEAIKRVQGVRMITPRWQRGRAEKVMATVAVRRTGYTNNVVELMAHPRFKEGSRS